jgi:hypothetical protein
MMGSHAMMKHDSTCIYNPYALEEPEVELITYGQDAGNDKLGHFHSKERHHETDNMFQESIEELGGEDEF